MVQQLEKVATASQPLAEVAAPPPRRDQRLLPLDAAVIRSLLHGCIRQSFPRPLPERLTQRLPWRCQVPEEAMTVADRLNRKCHHHRIQALLVSHREVRCRVAPGGALH